MIKYRLRGGDIYKKPALKLFSRITKTMDSKNLNMRLWNDINEHLKYCDS